jgi:AraC-like DNA-binding protein
MDCKYFEPLTIPTLASTARLSPAHFSREFRRTFGETPHHYLLTRRLERAAALLRGTNRKVADICVSVGLESVGSFTTTFSRYFGCSPTIYRERFAPAESRARIPGCVVQAWGRPQEDRSFGEDIATPFV